jgi:hypothetical protein
LREECKRFGLGGRSGRAASVTVCLKPGMQELCVATPPAHIIPALRDTEGRYSPALYDWITGFGPNVKENIIPPQSTIFIILTTLSPYTTTRRNPNSLASLGLAVGVTQVGSLHRRKPSFFFFFWFLFLYRCNKRKSSCAISDFVMN